MKRQDRQGQSVGSETIACFPGPPVRSKPSKTTRKIVGDAINRARAKANKK